MKMKKILTMFLAAAMVFSLSACAKDSGDKAAGSTDANSTVKETEQAGDTLSVLIWDTFQQPGIQKLLDGFTEKTGIKAAVQVVRWDEYWTLLEAGAQGGTLPDVFWMHSNEAQRYMSNDMLLDITDKIEKSEQIDLANYPQDIVELYTYNNTNYAMPKDVDTIALWYNKTMFDEAGMDYPDDTWTWEDFREAAKKLTKDDGSQYGTAIRTDSNQEGYYNAIYAYGGNVINEDKTTSGYDLPETIKGLELIEGIIKDGSMPSLETMSENTVDVLFTSGKAAMVINGSWMLANYKENEYTAQNADIAVLPMGPDGNRVSIYNGLGWAGSANGAKTDQAWQLMEYLGSKEAQIQQAELGVTMSAYKGTSEAWAGSADFNLNAYLEMMDNMVIRPYSRNTIAWENNTNEKLKDAWTGNKSMADVCKELAADMNTYLSEE